MMKKRNVVIILTIMIVLQLGFVTYMFALQKEGFHSDDNWSYGFANADDGGWIEHDDNGKTRNFDEWTDGKALWDYITVQKGKQFDFGEVARNMKDERNPPLHHMILHAICSFFPETFSWWYGYAINVIAFIATLITLYFLGRELFGSEKKALLVCFFYGFSIAALNTSLFLRPYCMLTSLSVMLMYLHVRMYQKRFVLCGKELIGILITMVAGNLTQYTFMMYGMCIMIIFGIYELVKRKWKFALIHGSVMLLSVGITVLIWPRALQLLFAREEMYAAQMPLSWEVNFAMALSTQEATGIPFKVPDVVFWAYIKIIFAFVLIIVSGIAFICRHEEWFHKMLANGKKYIVRVVKWGKRKALMGDKIMVLIMLSVFSTVVVISHYCNLYVMSLYADRYFFFIMPFFSLIITGQIYWVIFHVCKRKKVYRGISILICVTLLLMEHSVLEPTWYLFKRQCEGPQLEKLTKEADVILVTGERWKLTWYSSKLYSASRFYAVLSEDCMKDETLMRLNELKEKENSEKEKPVYLVLETGKFRDETWDASKSDEKNGVKVNDEILTLPYKKSEVVSRFAKAEWATQKKFIEREDAFVGEIEVWQIR